MLVLSRKVEESIQIGEDITITVLEMRGDKVRIGIKAPTSVEIMRGELKDTWVGKTGQSVDQDTRKFVPLRNLSISKTRDS